MSETNKIFNLQNALLQIKHRLSKNEFEQLEVPKEQFEKQVIAELTRQAAEHFVNKIGISVTTNENETVFSGRGYILSEKEMLNTILEICQMDEYDRNKMEEAVKGQLKIN